MNAPPQYMNFAAYDGGVYMHRRYYRPDHRCKKAMPKFETEAKRGTSIERLTCLRTEGPSDSSVDHKLQVNGVVRETNQVFL